MTRGASALHSGQGDGSSHSAIGRSSVNGPHALHIYSYVGIEHLSPAETHPSRHYVAIIGAIYQLPAVKWRQFQKWANTRLSIRSRHQLDLY